MLYMHGPGPETTSFGGNVPFSVKMAIFTENRHFPLFFLLCEGTNLEKPTFGTPETQENTFGIILSMPPCISVAVVHFSNRASQNTSNRVVFEVQKTGFSVKIREENEWFLVQK